MPGSFRTWIDESKRSVAPLWAVTILRVYLGIAFLSAASNKIFSWWASWPQSMSHFLTSKLNDTYAFYRPVLTGLVLPHIGFFAPGIALSEVAVGLSLLLGAGTRFGAALGLVLIANYMLAFGEIPWQPGEDQAFFFGLVVVLITNPGWAFGVDPWLARARA
ncbi:MAG TPA: DoxX family protein [Gemmatimonadales bacterium]|nr:DoxX family protein [Gemmatimonadales bacterium]